MVPEEGIAAMVEVSMENFFTYSYEKMIYAENMMEELLDWQVSLTSKISESLIETPLCV